MGVKKIVTVVLEIGDEELELIPVTLKQHTINTSQAVGSTTMTSKITSLEIAGKSDEVAGYLIKLSEEDK